MAMRIKLRTRLLLDLTCTILQVQARRLSWPRPCPRLLKHFETFSVVQRMRQPLRLGSSDANQNLRERHLSKPLRSVGWPSPKQLWRNWFRLPLPLEFASPRRASTSVSQNALPIAFAKFSRLPSPGSLRPTLSPFRSCNVLLPAFLWWTARRCP